ncbi:MAG: flagellar FlbD family protein [Candidatus Aminicenantes bacterium]|nr:flagellar FlbD family protein [Candidatus Aminicenantes bacterium]
MIRVIRNDGMEILLNTTMIESVEKTPETIVTLTTGDKLVLKSHAGDVMQKIDANRLGVRDEERKENKKKVEKKVEKKVGKKAGKKQYRYFK